MFYETKKLTSFILTTQFPVLHYYYVIIHSEPVYVGVCKIYCLVQMSNYKMFSCALFYDFVPQDIQKIFKKGLRSDLRFSLHKEVTVRPYLKSEGRFIFLMNSLVLQMIGKL